MMAPREAIREECKAYPNRIIVGGPRDGRRIRVTLLKGIDNYKASYIVCGQPMTFKPLWAELGSSIRDTEA